MSVNWKRTGSHSGFSFDKLIRFALSVPFQVLMDTMKRYLKKQLMVLSPEDAVEPLEIQSVMGPQNHHEEAIIHIA